MLLILPKQCQRSRKSSEKYRSFIFRNGKGYSVNQIISEVEEIANSKIQIKICDRREGDPPVLFASAEKAFNELSWVPKYSGLKTIIESAYNWYRVINKSKNG